MGDRLQGGKTTWTERWMFLGFDILQYIAALLLAGMGLYHYLLLCGIFGPIGVVSASFAMRNSWSISPFWSRSEDAPNCRFWHDKAAPEAIGY